MYSVDECSSSLFHHGKDSGDSAACVTSKLTAFVTFSDGVTPWTSILQPHVAIHILRLCVVSSHTRPARRMAFAQSVRPTRLSEGANGDPRWRCIYDDPGADLEMRPVS